MTKGGKGSRAVTLGGGENVPSDGVDTKGEDEDGVECDEVD